MATPQRVQGTEWTWETIFYKVFIFLMRKLRLREGNVTIHLFMTRQTLTGYLQCVRQCINCQGHPDKDWQKQAPFIEHFPGVKYMVSTLNSASCWKPSDRPLTTLRTNAGSLFTRLYVTLLWPTFLLWCTHFISFFPHSLGSTLCGFYCYCSRKIYQAYCLFRPFALASHFP